MTLPDQCLLCTHYDDKHGGVCCHPDPFPGIIGIARGENCESFDQNYDLDEYQARQEAEFERGLEQALMYHLPED